MSTDDDLALKIAGPGGSIPIETLEYGIMVWKFILSKNKFGYYVATRRMDLEQLSETGCPYPKVNKQNLITSFQDARLFARDRVNWVREYAKYCTNPTPTVEVLNGPIAVF